jgi:Zn-dependent protease
MFLQTLETNPVLFFRFVVVIIVSVCLHELAHGLAAISQGDDTPIKQGHMTMNPVVHMGWESIVLLCLAGIAWGQMPVNPDKFRSPKFGNILVSAAGPLANLGLSLIFVLLTRLSCSDSSGQEFMSCQFLYMVAHINFVLFLFNLLPIPPLDGFHVLSELIPSLKLFQYGSYGLILMMLLFVNPAVGRGLSAVANLVILQLVG